MHSFRLPLFAGSAVLLLALQACQRSAPTHHDPAVPTVDQDRVTLPANSGSPVHFPVEKVSLQPALALPPVTGRVTTVATRTSPTFAPLPGRVVSVTVRLGDHVEKGDRLVEIRAVELPGLQQQLESARLATKTKQATVARIEQLVASRIAPESDLIIARSELSEAQLEVKAASDRIQALSVEQSGATGYFLRAASAGTVVQLAATPGQRVAPEDTEPVATIADLGEVLVEADVLQRDARQIAPGELATIVLSDGLDAHVSGRVQTVSEVVDPARQMVPVRILVENDAHILRPNSFVNVLFPTRTDQPVMVVPSAAVVSDGGLSVVFIEASPGSFLKRPVELGRRSKTEVEVKSGLLATDRVVTSNALLLLNAIDVDG